MGIKRGYTRVLIRALSGIFQEFPIPILLQPLLRQKAARGNSHSCTLPRSALAAKGFGVGLRI